MFGLSKVCCSRERLKGSSRAMPDEMIRILSIDGGGIRGIIPARILQRIEESTGKPASTLFHLMAGTSTGGILGCGLAKEKPARQIADLYAKRGGEIFHRSLWDKVTTIDGLSNPDYDPSPLERLSVKNSATPGSPRRKV